MKWLALIALLSGCVTTFGGAGCASYGEAQLSMPRPLPNDALGQWVAADLDARMTATCR